jgi:hypothetical protein
MRAPQAHMATVEAPATTPAPHRTTSTTELRVERAPEPLVARAAPLVGDRQVVIVVGASADEHRRANPAALAIFAAEVAGVAPIRRSERSRR